MTYTAGTDTIEHLAYLIHCARPDWDEQLVRVILRSHSLQVDGNDLAIAALRAAANPNFGTPKSIGWRGAHWRDLATSPPEMERRAERCTTCGKTEDRCYSERPGIDDDHAFQPIRPLVSA